MLSRRTRALTRLRAVATATAGLVLAVGLSAPASAGTAARRGFGSRAGARVVTSLRAAWQITRGHGVTVAVIAGGVDSSAAGLGGKVTQGPSFGPSRTDSAVAGTVFASAVAGAGPSSANLFGTLGLAPAARILALRMPPNAMPGIWEIDESEAIRYAAAHGAQVIFVMLAGYAQSSGLDSAVQHAEARGAVVVGEEYWAPSVGNGPEYPESLPGVIDAASATLPGLPTPPREYRSPANNSVLVTAPANTIATSGPAGQSYLLFGYLASAAWLTATAALVKSVYPRMPAAGVERAIAVSARDHPARGYTTTVGFGLINPVGALRAAQAIEKLRTTATPGSGVAAPGARLAGGPPPGPIDAVHHPPAVLAADGGAVVLGMALLAIAALLWRRRGWRPGPEPAAPADSATGTV